MRVRIINPLAGILKPVLLDQVSRFCANHGLQDKDAVFQKGALVAQSPHDFENIPELDEDDKFCLRAEINRKLTAALVSFLMRDNLLKRNRPMVSPTRLVLHHSVMFAGVRYSVRFFHHAFNI